MNFPADDETPPPTGLPLDPAYLQPRRWVHSQQARQEEESEANPPAGEFDPAPPEPPVEVKPPEGEPRPAAYRPPARGTETHWSSTPSEPVPSLVPPVDPVLRWRLPLLLFLLGLGIGGLVGFGIPAARKLAPPGNGPETGRGPGAVLDPIIAAPLSPYAGLPPETLAALVSDVDDAYNLLRAGKFSDADASLRAAQERRPNPPGRLSGVPPGWPELEVERARVRFYAGDLKGADQALDKLIRAPGTASARADALLLRALIQGALRVPAEADALFAAAVAANPARADTFYFWGDALRTGGRPAESIPKFRAALLRNQFETMDGLIRVKLWSSQFQVDAQAPEAAAAVDAALAPPNVPTGYAWLGAAARAIHDGQFAEAAGALRKARPLLEPVVFRVVLSDPMFAEQNWRPEWAEFSRR